MEGTPGGKQVLQRAQTQPALAAGRRMSHHRFSHFIEPLKEYVPT